MTDNRVFDTPTRYGQTLRYSDLTAKGQMRNLNKAFLDIRTGLDLNRIRSLDGMTYASTALAAAAWVASDAVAASGVTVARNAAEYVEGTSAVEFTTGTGTFASDVTVRLTLTPNKSTYVEDLDGSGHIDLRWANYVGFIIYADAATAATDIDIVFRDKNDHTATQSVDAQDANHCTKYQTVDLKLADFTSTGVDWSCIKDVAFIFTSGMGTTESVTIDDLQVYAISNGYGPCMGATMPVYFSEAGITRGAQIKHVPAGMRVNGQTANAGDEMIFGVACTNGTIGDIGLVQYDGLTLMEFGSLTSLEAGDSLACADASGLTVTEANGSQEDAWCVYNEMLHDGDTPAQYEVAWINVGRIGAVPD